MTQDIYTNTSAFGLMSEEMQAQMKAHPGPWAYYDITGYWARDGGPCWDKGQIYRAVRPPEPPKVYEAWLVLGPHKKTWTVYLKEDDARALAPQIGGTVIHMTGSKKDE